MNKKPVVIFFVILVLLLVSGGIFWWWQSRAELRKLNKDLPEGVKITKELTGKFKIENKQDGYTILTPDNWEKMYRVDYMGEESGLAEPVITLEPVGGERVDISCISAGQNQDLETWAKNYDDSFSTGERILLEKETINDINVIKIERRFSLAGGKIIINKYLYTFQRETEFCLLGSEDEEAIRNIIINSKW